MLKESVFAYQGTNITFSKGDAVMVNATEMAKPFGKRPVDWLQNAATQEFLSALSEVRKSTSADLVQVTKGGSVQGTWMHEDVAIEFARWLSPAFAIWCNDRIKELLTEGVATVDDDDATILKAVQVLQKRVADSQKQLQAASNTIEQQEERIELQSEQLKIQAPKVAYYDAAMDSGATYSTTAIAKGLGTNAQNLNKILHKLGVQYPQNGTWYLYSRYENKGFTKVIPRYYTHRDGTLDYRRLSCQTMALSILSNFRSVKGRFSQMLLRQVCEAILSFCLMTTSRSSGGFPGLGITTRRKYILINPTNLSKH